MPGEILIQKSHFKNCNMIRYFRQEISTNNNISNIFFQTYLLKNKTTKLITNKFNYHMLLY